MIQKSRNILSVKRKRGQMATPALFQMFRSDANVCMGVEAVCGIMSGYCKQVKNFKL